MDFARKIVPPDIGVLLLPLGLVVVFVIVFLGVFVFFYDRISVQLASIAENSKVEQALSQKLNLLSTVELKYSDSAEAAVIALPDKNDSLSFVSQVRLLAAKQPLLVRSVEIASEQENKVGNSAVVITFVLDGELAQIINFLETIPNYAPVSSLSSFDLKNDGDLASSKIEFKVYYAPFPKTLPATIEPVHELSDNQKKVLADIESLIPPEFSYSPSEATISGRENPF